MQSRPRLHRESSANISTLRASRIPASYEGTPGRLMRSMRSLLRRLTVPLIGTCLVIVVVIIALVALDLGGSTGDGAGALPVIQIGSVSATPAVDVTDTIGATTVTVPESPLGGQAQGQGQGSRSTTGQGYRPDPTQGQGGTAATGSTLRGGKTTIVTEGVRIQPGPGSQGGSSSAGTSTTTSTTTTTTPAENPAPTVPDDGSTTTYSTQTTSSTGGPYGSTSTTGPQGPSTTGGSGGGMHGTPSTMRGR